MPIKHGMTRVAGRNSPLTPTYISWQRMKGRCLNKNDTDYSRYGGRGISICARWLESFDAFLADMGLRPKNSVLDRTNNDGNYGPENCRWVSIKQSSRNRSSNRLITIRGITRTLVEWCEVSGLGETFASRIYEGWAAERALNTPKQIQFRRRLP